LVTVTLTAPADPAGVVALSELLLTKLTLLAAAPPKVTFAPETKLLPVMLTTVPPPVGPELGDTELMLGAALVVPPVPLKATNCITQVEEPAYALTGAVAL
jgi:hypothetical protein